MSMIKGKSRLFKWKNILKSRHFRSSFFLTFLFSTLIFLIGGFLITVQNLMKLQEQLEMKANYTVLAVQESISNMRNSAVFMGNLPSVNHILNTEKPSIDQLSRMIYDVTPYSSIYSYETICIFFNRSERMFDSSGGMYDYSDFYNPGLITSLEAMTGEDMWLIIPYQRYYRPDVPVPVITYARKLPLFESATRGYVCVSYSMEKLQKLAADSVRNCPYTVALTFDEKLLWSSSASVMADWNPNLTVNENENTLFPDSSRYSSIANIGTQCSFYVSDSELLTAVLPVLLQWFLIYLAAIAAVFAASVVYSIIMLRPVDAIMRKLGDIPYTENAVAMTDEFSLLSTALDKMTAQVSDIKAVMHENQQLVRERLLSGILYNYVDIGRLPGEYEQHGIIFPYSGFAVILVALPSLYELEDYTQQEQLKLLVRSNTTSAFSVLGAAYSLYVEDKSICIILNTGLSGQLQEELLKVCTALKKRMKQSLSIYPLFSIGICQETDPKPWQSWQLARKNFIFAAPYTDDFVQFSYQNEFTSSVDQDLLDHLSHSILDKDGAALKKWSSVFRSRYVDTTDPENGRRHCVIAFCTIYSALLDIRMDVPENQLNTLIRKLEHASSADECFRMFRSCLFGMLDHKNKLSIESHGYINNAVQYLELHYAQQITIPQIAEYAGVSPIYLTKIFKLSTGKTLSEYLNYYRTQRSLDMLIHTDETINVISESVGYSDVRSFIRFFKKFYDMTPSEYRKKNL